MAALYGVETRDINKAVRNNPNKFPEGYVFELDRKEFEDLRWKNSTTNIAKTRKATQTTITLVETFAKIRELAHTVAELSNSPEEFKQKTLMQKGGEIISDILSDDLQVTDVETSIEINFALMKFKHTVKQKRK